MKLFVFNPRHKQAGVRVATAIASLAALISMSDLMEAAKLRDEQSVAMRPAGEPIMAIVSLRDQQVTVYDDKGWIMRAQYRAARKAARHRPVSSASFKKRPSTTPTFMTMPSCLTCSASLGRASRSTVDLCRDTPHRTAAFGCPTALPNGCSARQSLACASSWRQVTLDVAIDHPALFQPKTGQVAAAAAAATANAEEATVKADQARLVATTAFRELALAIASVRKRKL